MPEEWTITIIRDTNSVSQNSTLDIFLFSSLPQNIPQANYIFFIFCNSQNLSFFNCHIRKQKHWKGKSFLKNGQKIQRQGM